MALELVAFIVSIPTTTAMRLPLEADCLHWLVNKYGLCTRHCVLGGLAGMNLEFF